MGYDQCWVHYSRGGSSYLSCHALVRATQSDIRQGDARGGNTRHTTQLSCGGQREGKDKSTDQCCSFYPRYRHSCGCFCESWQTAGGGAVTAGGGAVGKSESNIIVLHSLTIDGVTMTLWKYLTLLSIRTVVKINVNVT